MLRQETTNTTTVIQSKLADSQLKKVVVRYAESAPPASTVPANLKEPNEAVPPDAVPPDAVISVRPVAASAVSNDVTYHISYNHLMVFGLLVGRGSAASIFHYSYNGNPVAVKVYNCTPMRLRKEVCEEEARVFSAVTQLGVPHTVQYYGLMQAFVPGVKCLSRSIYPGLGIVMERMSHSLYASYIRYLPLTKQYKLFSCVTEAVACLHRNNITHNDITSSNILWDEKGNPKLSDFGLAHFLNDGKSVSGRGTPGWWAPEVRAGGPNTTQSDVYSLGVLFWSASQQKDPCCDYDALLIEERMRIHSPRFVKLFFDCVQVDPANRPAAQAVHERIISPVMAAEFGIGKK
jgi:serine/threonine protein kinase